VFQSVKTIFREFYFALAISKQGKIKLPEDGLDRLKHVGVVGSILTK